MSGIKLVFGGAGLGSSLGAFTEQHEAEQAIEALKAGGVDVIDTAQIYNNSEEVLGKLGAASKFVIDTKDGSGFAPVENNSKEKIIERFNGSLERLKTKQVDIFYIHAPISDVPLEDQLSAFDSLHKEGKFKRFGLSNFPAEKVQEVYDLAKAKGYVLPSVYQGNYNPVARRQETELFPTLRKLGMAFYAYSPLAGGFLTKTKQQVQEGVGRFQKGTMVGDLYSKLYSKPELLEALAQWEQIAKDEGASRADLAYRWVRFNSPLKVEHGDAIIFGAGGPEQLTQTLKGLKAGPLSADAAKRIDQLWETVKHVAPLDNLHG